MQWLACELMDVRDPWHKIYSKDLKLRVLAAVDGRACPSYGLRRTDAVPEVSRFEPEGVNSPFTTERAKRLALPLAIRRFVVDLKAERPPMRPNEIATVCYVRFGRRPDDRTVKKVLKEYPIPLRAVRCFRPTTRSGGAWSDASMRRLRENYGRV